MTRPPDGALNFRRSLPGLYRSGNLSRLSERGRGELLNLGLSRIIDLRTRAERGIDPPPFLGRTEYLNLSILPQRCRELNETYANATSNAQNTTALLDHGADQIVSILGAMLDAPPGPVLVHCHAGKDRTGLIAALCLEQAGRTCEQIANDYVQSARELTAFYADQQARKSAADWARIDPFVPSVSDDILLPLNHLDERWGGVGSYLSAYGLSPAEQAALGARLGRSG